MSTERRANLPLPLLLAPWSPSAVLLAASLARQAGAPIPEVAPTTLALLWLCTTVPLVLLVAGLDAYARRAQTTVDERHLAEALAALRQADAVSRQAAAALVQAQQAYAANPAAPGASAPASGAASPARWRQAAVVAALAILLVAGGGALAFAFARDPVGETFIHEHATFALFVDGERVRFDDPAFDLATRGFMRGHLHAPDDATIHVEGAPGLTLGEFFERTLGARLASGGALALEDGRSVAGVRLFVAPRGGDWGERTLELASYQPRDGDRILLTTATTAEEAGRQMMAVPGAG